MDWSNVTDVEVVWLEEVFYSPLLLDLSTARWLLESQERTAQDER